MVEEMSDIHYLGYSLSKTRETQVRLQQKGCKQITRNRGQISI
jgi:hypothetical protein